MKNHRLKIRLILGLAFLHLILPQAICLGATYYVAKNGSNNNPGTISSPWATIQHAADTVAAGDTVYVRAGTYNEKITINVSGSASGGYITFQNYNNENVTIDGRGSSGQNMIYLRNKNYIKIIGFDICNNTGVSDGSGIRIVDSGHHLELRNNRIHEIRGDSAMGITVYAHTSAKVQNLIIDGNEIFDCDPAWSEALVVNGNVEDFEITNNVVHDVNNIGIDVIGGEVNGTIARRGLVKGNVVYRARTTNEGGYAAGIYVDGGVDITIEANIVYECDLGISLGCENRGFVVSGCVVRNNLIFNNDKTGLIIGGYGADKGRVNNCTFVNNVLYKNQTLRTGAGELWIEYASGNVIRNNIIYAGPQGILLSIWEGSQNNQLDYNCWYSETASTFIWDSREYSSLSSYNSSTGQDRHSIQANPQFVNAGNRDFHLRAGSPAIDAGADVGLTRDFDGNAVPQGAGYDIGAYEYAASRPFVYGDVSGDGEVSAYDAALTAHIAVGLAHQDIKNRAAADVSGDGEVSAYDAALIAQRAVGLINKFPVE